MSTHEINGDCLCITARYAAWLIAMLVSSGCESVGTSDVENKSLDVDNLWQGDVPGEYEINRNNGLACLRGETNLLIPYSISETSSFEIELYGCWMNSSLITCSPGETFEEARVDTDSSRVRISFTKRDWVGECQAIPPTFGKYHTIEVNGSWQRGELEIVVENSGVELTGFITVE